MSPTIPWGDSAADFVEYMLKHHYETTDSPPNILNNIRNMWVDAATGTTELKAGAQKIQPTNYGTTKELGVPKLKNK